jgi:hypothetical protein
MGKSVAVPGASEWTSLEIAKLALAALTPILLFALGLIVTRAARRVEEAQWANRKLIERRLELYEQMAPKLNDLFCFFMLVGHFKEIEPPDAIQRKRELDRIFHANAPLFGREFAERYRSFIAVCFSTFFGTGEDAKLKTDASRQRFERIHSGWKQEWDAMFTERAESSAEQVEAAYDSLMDCFAQELGVRQEERRSRAWLKTHHQNDR